MRKLLNIIKRIHKQKKYAAEALRYDPRKAIFWTIRDTILFVRGKLSACDTCGWYDTDLHPYGGKLLCVNCWIETTPYSCDRENCGARTEYECLACPNSRV